MAGVGITVEVAGLTALEARLGVLLARTSDLSPLMERIGMAMETTTSERFEAGEAPDGTKWQKSHRVQEEGGKTLVDTGRLRQSITHRASADRVEIGTNLIYARIHQFGGVIRPKAGEHLAFTLPGVGLVIAKSVTMPVRPFLGLSVEDREEIAAQVEDYLLEDADGAA